jgi:CPA2 family monovalent cation:H+ antiporter-2
MDSATHGLSRVFIELGLVVVGLAVLARIASRWGFSAIPLYLIAGLAFGNGGLVPLGVSQNFIHIGAEIGVLLLLFMLGVEYTGEELKENLQSGFPSGVIDFALNFPPGFITGLLLRWGLLPSVLLGGVTYISSSGIIAKVLAELNRTSNPETPSVVSVLVLEDLAMAVYLPLIAALLVGGGLHKTIWSVFIALVTVGLILLVALRYGRQVSKLFLHESDEILLLTTSRRWRGGSVAGFLGNRGISRRHCPVWPDG